MKRLLTLAAVLALAVGAAAQHRTVADARAEAITPFTADSLVWDFRRGQFVVRIRMLDPAQQVVVAYDIAEHQPVIDTGWRVDRVERIEGSGKEGMEIRVTFKRNDGKQTWVDMVHCLPPPPDFCTTRPAVDVAVQASDRAGGQPNPSPGPTPGHPSPTPTPGPGHPNPSPGPRPGGH